MLFTDSFKRLVKRCDCEAVYDAPMSEYTSFKVGGKADLLITPNTEDALLGILSAAKATAVPVTIIGNGSNLLVSDKGIQGLVIRISGGLTDVSVSGDVITCGAGVLLHKLCLIACDNSFSGLEFAYGIPGTVGGALFMNAGAYCGEMKDVVVSARHIDDDLMISELTADKLELSYRHSIYSENKFTILSVSVKLNKGDKPSIRAAMDDCMKKRKDKQPLEYPSAGSAFKRPKGNYASALIDRCGLKGYSIGGAAVSEKHAGFIINKDNAKADDILRLLEYVKSTVYKQKGILLEPEVRMLGF